MPTSKQKQAPLVLLTGALTSALLSPGLVFAQESPPPAANRSLSQFGEAATIAAQEIVVTAQRRSQRLTEVPLTINVQNAEALQRQGVTTTQQIYQLVSGVTMDNRGAWLQPAIRGVTTLSNNAGNSSNIATYIDGVYIPDQLAARLDLPDVERIEVLKGPQGTLFGRNATGGAIQVFTKGPTFEPAAHVEASYGSFDNKTVSLFTTQPLIADTLAFSLSGYLEDGDGYTRDFRTGDRVGGINSKVLRGKVKLIVSHNWTSLFSASWVKRDDTAGPYMQPYSPETTRAIRDPNAANIIPTRPYYVGSNTLPFTNMKDLRLAWRNDLMLSFGTLTSLTAYSKLNATNQLDLDGTVSTVIDVPYLMIKKDTMWSEELTFVGNKIGDLGYTLGVFLYSDTNAQPRSEANHGIPATTSLLNRSIAVFGEAYYDFSEAFQLTAGVRYTVERINGYAYNALARVDVDKTWKNMSPRVSALYRFGPSTSAYVTLSKGFKSGGFNTASLQDLPPYDPEKLRSWEIGFKTAGANYTLNLAAFDYRYQGMQLPAAQQTAFGIATIVGNVASAKLRGLDFDASFSPISRFNIRGNFSWMPKAQFTSYPNASFNTVTPTPLNNGVPTVNGGCPTQFSPPCGPITIVANMSGARLQRTPRFAGNLSADYTVPGIFGGNLNASGSIYYVSRANVTLDGYIHQNAYALLGATLGWTSDNERFKILVRGTNLTNKAAITGSSDAAFGQIVNYNRPRSVQVILSTNF